ncbi:MAG: NnrU protein [SAR86 cluster bacterium]|uniref:NnrU protein n=1 Tax=SAR86 cluster bacterium TaxID=2030880 RepID=A0A2A4MUK7_9GAMM|nr:MAG: NnrU protein [SAR86 cluster bacterium]
MLLLIAGIALWTIVHFIPSAGIGLKQKCISQFGLKAYSIAFALLILASLILIVFGWRSSAPSYLYSLPPVFKVIAILLMLIAFQLFGAVMRPSKIKSYVRHPQLTGLIVWSTGHLLVNGDTRSLLLFGGLGLWAMVEIFLINRREGEWIKAEVPSWIQEIKGIVISLVIFLVVIAVHPLIAGVRIM